MRRIRPGMTEFELERYAGKNKELKHNSHCKEAVYFTILLGQYIKASVWDFPVMTSLSVNKWYLIGSLRNSDRNGTNNATNQWFDCLNEEKYSCCLYGTLFGAIFWHSLPNGNVGFDIWGSDDNMHKPAAVNLSFFAITWKLFMPRKRKYTFPTLYKVTNME